MRKLTDRELAFTIGTILLMGAYMDASWVHWIAGGIGAAMIVWAFLGILVDLLDKKWAKSIKEAPFWKREWDRDEM